MIENSLLASRSLRLTYSMMIIYKAKKLLNDGKKYLAGKGVVQNFDVALNFFDNAITKDPSKHP